MSTRYLLDTNLLLRFLSGQPPAQAEAVKRLFSRAAAGEVVLDISPIIVDEAYDTLTSFYGVDSKTAAEQISLLIQQHGVRLRDADQVFGALRLLQTVNVGFADAFLAAGAMAEKVPVASFDRDFDKLKGMTRFEPPV